MRYLPLDAMRRVRGSGAAPLSEAAAPLAIDPEAAVASLGGSDHARVAVGLLLLGLAAADESHAVITPLSWEEGTQFGGPPMLGSAAAAEASYAHALVHRHEAWHVGEFGTGWHNSAFWFGLTAAKQSADVAAVHQACAAAARARATTASPEASAWVAEALADGWAPRMLNGLCAQAVRGELSEPLAAFASWMAEMELRALMDHCLRCAGYEPATPVAPHAAPVLEAAAEAGSTSSEAGTASSQAATTQAGLAAARGLSDAHAAAFVRDGRVLLRGLLLSDGLSRAEAAAAEAALAARLLDAPACREAAAGEAGTVALLRAGDAAAAGTWLGPSDALATRVDTGTAVEGRRVFAACAAGDGAAVWVDPLHGARGVCPTSVLQWSKGTVHHASGE